MSAPKDSAAYLACSRALRVIDARFRASGLDPVTGHALQPWPTYPSTTKTGSRGDQNWFKTGARYGGN